MRPISRSPANRPTPCAARGEKPSDDVQLANYDVLFVPKTGVADVYTAYNQYFKQFLPSNIGLNFGTHF